MKTKNANQELETETSTQFMDAAFVQAKDFGWSQEGHRKAKANLSHLFPQHSRNEIARTYATARALVKACYDVGDRCRAELLTREQAEAFLAKNFPDFGRETYEKAVSYGMFISR